MRSELAELWRFRNLLWQLVRRDLKVRYKNSRLGFLWSIAPSLMQVAVMTFMMRYATDLARNFPNLSAYLLVGIIPWTYFSTALLDSSGSILLMYGVIRKVYLPREIVPLASVLSNFIHFLVSWGVFFVYWWLIRRGPILWSTLVWFPYLVLTELMLVTGLALYISCLNVFYEDVKYIITIVLNLLLFVLPIMIVADQIYYKGHVGHKLFNVYMLNPITAIITGFRRILLEPPPIKAVGGPPLGLDVPNMLEAGLLSFAILVSGYAFFNARKWRFVERP